MYNNVLGFILKRLILFICAILFISCTNKPNAGPESISNYRLKFSKKSKLASMPKGLYGMSSVNDGKYIYVINGIASNSPLRPVSIKNTRLNLVNRAIPNINEIYAYNIVKDEWSSYPDRISAKAYGNAEYIDGNIYIFNGQYRIKDGYSVHEGANKKVEIFDTKTIKISDLENNPHPAYHAWSSTWGNKIYVFGGSHSQSLISNYLLVYDPIKDDWFRLNDMPIRAQTRGEIVDGVLFTFGGYIGNSRKSKEIHSYNIAKDEWKYIGDMPNRLSANAICGNGDLIWLIGDYSNLSRVSVFDTKTNEFINIKTNLLGRRYAGAEIVGDKLYVFGGAKDSQNSFLSSIQVADISEIENLLSSNENSLNKEK